MSKKIAVQTAVHTYRFMEVANLGEFDKALEPYPKPGFVAVCDHTGVMVATDDTDGWQWNPGAPKKPIHRVPFALNLFCKMPPIAGGARTEEPVTHVLNEEE